MSKPISVMQKLVINKNLLNKTRVEPIIILDRNPWNRK